MTIAKITESNIRPLDEVDKINEIIDEVNNDEIFIAEYDVTTYQEVLDAYSAGKTIVCKSSGFRCLTIAYDPTFRQFVFSGVLTDNLSDIKNLLLYYIILNSSDNWSIVQKQLADTDLSNLSATGKTVIDGQWINVGVNIAQDLNLNNSKGTAYAINLSSYLPNDDYNYAVMIDASIISSATSGQYCNLILSSSNGLGIYIANCRPRTNATVQSAGNGILFVDSSRIIRVTRQPNYYGTANINLKWYRRIGTNT